jgi:hypothetical protein
VDPRVRLLVRVAYGVVVVAPLPFSRRNIVLLAGGVEETARGDVTP